LRNYEDKNSGKPDEQYYGKGSSHYLLLTHLLRTKGPAIIKYLFYISICYN